MQIRYLGHAAFLLTTEGGLRLITDPYEPGAFGGAIGFGAIPDEADIVTVSHAHVDHGDVASLSGRPVAYREPGQFQVDGITLKGVATYHDTTRGQERGPNIVWVVGAEGLQVCHLGDLGAVLEAGEVRSVGPVDVLLVPVGGTFTIDAAGARRVAGLLKPRLVIPMHYRTPKVKLDLDPVDTFLQAMRGERVVRQEAGSDLHITSGNLPKEPGEVVVLSPAL